jgi:hypothetical protein
MKRQVDGTARCQNILAKKQVDEMASWWNGKAPLKMKENRAKNPF